MRGMCFAYIVFNSLHITFICKKGITRRTYLVRIGIVGGL